MCVYKYLDVVVKKVGVREVIYLFFELWLLMGKRGEKRKGKEYDVF